MSTPTWLVATFNQPVLIRQRVPDGIDEYGNVTYTEVDITTVGLLRPMTSSDIQFGRAAVASMILMLPAENAPDVNGFVSFVIDGLTYEADGPGEYYTALHATGGHHLEIAVFRSSA